MINKRHVAERSIERTLVASVKKRGGLCPKWVSPGLVGVPDRVILLPGGRLAFAELKAPEKKPRAVQQQRIEQLRRLGFKVYIIDSKEQIPEILKKIGGDAQ